LAWERVSARRARALPAPQQVSCWALNDPRPLNERKQETKAVNERMKVMSEEHVLRISSLGELDEFT